MRIINRQEVGFLCLIQWLSRQQAFQFSRFSAQKAQVCLSGLEYHIADFTGNIRIHGFSAEETKVL